MTREPRTRYEFDYSNKHNQTLMHEPSMGSIILHEPNTDTFSPVALWCKNKAALKNWNRFPSPLFSFSTLPD